MIRRPFAAFALAVGLLLLLVAPTLAGGWAEVRPDAATSTQPPREGQPLVLGFTVLQHGQTPAGWVTPTVRLMSLSGAKGLEAVATPSGADGHFTVTLTLDTAGYWSWVVTFPELISDEIPQTLVVADADGVIPAFDPAMAISAMDRVRTEVRDEIFDSLDPQLQRIDSQLSLQRSIDDRLTQRIDELTAERDALAAAADGAITPASIAGVVLLAVLAGAAAGVAMVWLAGRGGVRQVEPEPSLSPTPRGSTPA